MTALDQLQELLRQIGIQPDLSSALNDFGYTDIFSLSQIEDIAFDTTFPNDLPSNIFEALEAEVVAGGPSASAVPEPSSGLMLLSLLLGLIAIRDARSHLILDHYRRIASARQPRSNSLSQPAAMVAMPT